MITALFILLASLILVYILALRFLYRGFGRLDFADEPHRLPTVTVIVPARNEAQHIDALFASLKRQNYPMELLEFCIIDDRSSDGTYARIEAFARELPNVKPLRITNTVPHVAPKKRAIDLGIRRSSGEIIMTTDADSRPGEDWVRTFARNFANDVAMICGHSPYHPRQTFLQKILALDFFSLAAVSAAGIGIDMPLTCTGGNLAYRRRAYYAIGGFEKIASFVSGDDDLLLHEMHRRKPGRILYLTEPAAAVPTAPPVSWRQFFWQRIRFASKGMHYKSRMTVGLVAVYVMNFLLAAGPLAAVILGKWNLLGSLLALWSAKAVIELLFLQRAAQLFGESTLLRYFFIASILHPFYITVFGALGQFMSFRWKGERFQRTLSTDPVTGAKR